MILRFSQRLQKTPRVRGFYCRLPLFMSALPRERSRLRVDTLAQRYYVDGFTLQMPLNSELNMSIRFSK